MLAEEGAKAIEKRNVLVGIRIGSSSRELLDWALFKVAEPGDCVVAVHVCGNSGQALKGKPFLDSYLEVYDGLCSMKKVDLTGEICTGVSVCRTLVRQAKNHAAVAVVVGISNRSALGSWASTARYCAKRLPLTTDILAIHNGKIVFRRFNNNQPPGLSGDPKPSLNLIEIPISKESRSEFGNAEPDTEISSFEVMTVDGSEDSKYQVSSLASDHKKKLTSPFAGDILDYKPGWPLLRRAILPAPRTREISAVEWALSLPDRSPCQNSRGLNTESPSHRGRSHFLEESNRISSYVLDELENGLDVLLKTNSYGCKRFSYEVLKTSTSYFHAENLIGKGGCNHVYKGTLPDGKPVAVKIQKSCQEAVKDFVHEVDIISSLDHKHIAPLVGVCIEDSRLISVYDFFSKGSLEENLHDKNKDKPALSWEVRFNIAVKIAEAINYLHNECSQPVIHRDIKSSNILLSDRFDPQLSDFGLAIWGPTASSFVTESNVVGTFGYLAPEYFMYGRVSDKIDVYAFGVILLELITGKKPVGSENPKGQESLVMWAKPIIVSGDARGMLDPNLNGDFDEAQMQRMILAAKLCITQAARQRPKMNEILNLLMGDKDMEKCDIEDPENQDNNDDEVYPNSSAELHLNLAFLDIDDDSTSFSSLEQGNILSFEEYLKERWSRSSSFN